VWPAVALLFQNKSGLYTGTNWGYTSVASRYLLREPLRMASTEAEYDIFLSHAWADGERPQQLADALTKAGLRVWFDAAEINDFASITRAVTEGLAKSKTLLAYYSKTYPLRRACQWELTAAFLAAQTEGNPRRRVLMVSPEEKPDHIHPIELRDAKFRNAPKDDVEMRELTEAIRNHVAAIDGPLADIRPLTSPNWYGMTPVGSTYFVGRMKEMWEVHSLLHAGDAAQVSYAAAATGGIGRISGLGGVGKSLLAEEYALHFGAAYPGGVFWVRAYGNDDATAALGPEQREALRADQLRRVAERLGIDTHGLTVQQTEGELARRIGSVGKPCLWVVDDVPNGLDGEALRHWFAPHALARTLLTTRSGEYGSLTKGIDLSVLTPEEAHQLLTSRRPPAGKAEEEHARELARDLGYHALALDVTASALVSSVAVEPYSDFRAKLARPDKDALALAESLADALPNGHEKSIAQTMLRSIHGLGAEGRDFLRLASVLAVAPIPASLLTAVFEKTDKLSREDAEERASLAFRQATSASLAEIAGENQSARSVHTLVSRAVRFNEKSAPGRTTALRAAAVEALGSEIGKAAKDPRLHKQIEFHVAHARQLVVMPGSLSEATLVGWVARYDYERGSYASAQTLWMRELEVQRRVLGPEHPEALTSMNNQANALAKQGDFAGARDLQEQTLALRRRLLGPEHPDTLNSMSGLASTLVAQGDLRGSRKLKEETLAIELRVLGPRHPRTIILMDNLANTLRMQGDLANARKLQEVVIARSKDVFGMDHPDTLTSMNNLALTMEAQGDLAGARKLQEEVLSIQQRVHGPQHPSAAVSMDNLASTLKRQGDLVAARKLQEDTLVIFRRELGPEHPDTLISMNNLATTVCEQGDYARARQLQEDTLAVRLRVLGLEHPDTSNAAWNLFLTLFELGDDEAASAVLKYDLLWLLNRDPATLGATQREVREEVARFLKSVSRPPT
jgi:tetratricopeptide (TPR) repeat protein